MKSIKEEDKKYIWHPFNQMKGAEIIPIVKGDGAYVYDEDGKRYIDAVASWWVNVHGHCNPYLAKALTEQASTLEHVVFGGFTHPKAVELSKRIINLLPTNIAKVFFSDNGSTSTEIAIKLALQYHYNKGKSRKLFIALAHGYHGDTFGSMSVTARGGFNEPFENHLFDVVYIPAPTNDNLQEVAAKVSEILSSNEVAGFIFEPLVQGAGGMLMHDADALSQIIKMCQADGVICIADEVMTGYGRTGKMFACEYLSVAPDIVCLSKGITGGFMPMGITAMTDEIYYAFYSDKPKDTFLHGHSYTGNALSCALGVANLEIFEKENTMKRVGEIGNIMESFLKKIIEHKGIKTARRQGVILAIELKTEKETSYFNSKGRVAYKYFLKKGIIMRPLGNVIVMIPPYCISDEDLQYIFTEIENFLEENQEG